MVALPVTLTSSFSSLFASVLTVIPANILAPASLPSDLGTILAALFMLFGVPLILFALIFLYTGYVRYDAEQYLDELEELEGEGSVDGVESAEGAEDTERTEGAENEWSHGSAKSGRNERDDESGQRDDNRDTSAADRTDRENEPSSQDPDHR
ncbi:hypothetical protein C483_04254 [Natrialba hulunbeirensis JCM 10989]|uniref:Uncharacterized protein n=1 Tax=Natrialba hulunbeirensis JCM 10989 TaxID=1227493 RepID=M0A529_9EURY|nr:hypothetical protein [Natrialba hulunbeirensis]ELY93860.1 hypothetical protein C483_04254 [Natrialba hulunbeirensis JCM 10989]